MLSGSIDMKQPLAVPQSAPLNAQTRITLIFNLITLHQLLDFGPIQEYRGAVLVAADGGERTPVERETRGVLRVDAGVQLREGFLGNWNRNNQANGIHFMMN